MHQAAALLIALLQPTALDARFAALFTPLEYRYTGGGYVNELFRYRLLVPNGADEYHPKPLVVWLHGIGESGDDNMRQLNWLEHSVFGPPWNKDDYPFFLLAVQCSGDNSHWLRNGRKAPDEMVNVLGAILQQTLKDYPVDPDRVYLSGLSSGGSACWIIASEHPEWFAAVAPLASGGAGLHRIPKLAKVPIWAFHSSRDSTLSPERDRAMIAGLAKAGGVARLTEIDSTDHDCWTAAFRDHHLMSWLLAQHRNGPIWQWWQILLQIVVIVGFVGFARLVYWLFRRVQIARELAQAA